MDQPRLVGGRYELGGVLGRGGMAEVQMGRDLRLGRNVAVKTLRADLASDPTFQARFRREAQSAASLNHPAVVAVYDTGEDLLNGTPLPYIVMEYVDGTTLQEFLQSGRRLPPERALEIVAGVLQALEYSHFNGIVHRDIKPGNVMLTRSGHVKVMDFGIARAIADATMTDAEVIGIAQYLTPERVSGGHVDARSDIYSTGCLLYELLVGRPPFVGDSAVWVAHQHVHEDPLPPSQCDPAVSPDIDAIVLKALAKRPENRYRSADEMRADIDLAVAGRPVEAARRIATPPERPASSRSSPTLSHQTSPMQSGTVPTSIRSMSASGLDKRYQLSTVTSPRVVTIKKADVIGHKGGTLRQEDHGDDVYTFDNSRSSSTSVETIHVAHTAKVEITIDLSKARSPGGQAGIRFLDFASIEGQIKSEIRMRHELALKEELVFDQTTAISIPASTHVRVVFHWKRVWQEGTVTLGQRGAALAEVPYAITIALRFDKETSDIT
jgi:serine/threonine protein kinase